MLTSFLVVQGIWGERHIATGDALPIRQAPRMLAIQAMETLQEQGLIEPSDSLWASPVVLVRKNGNWRSV